LQREAFHIKISHFRANWKMGELLGAVEGENIIEIVHKGILVLA
jgi:hypothetical protein